MRRRLFVTGTVLAALAAAALRRPATRPGGAEADAEPLADGRWLVRGTGLAFGTVVSVAVVHGDPDAARGSTADALARIRRVDELMTVYRPRSQIARLNARGVLEDPDPLLVRVLEAAQRIAALSGGAFDVTVQPLWTLYATCARAGRLPSGRELASARALVGFEGLEVGPTRIALRRPGMGITLNGVAQGYAADLAVAALRDRGVRDFLVDAGEHGAGGARPPGASWTLGLRHPRAPDAFLGALRMDGRFVAVSGDYAAPFSPDLRHHQVFDPRTGESPLALSTVAVAAASGLEADALTKPMMVLEPPRALGLLARFPGAGALLFDKSARLVASRGLSLEPLEASHAFPASRGGRPCP